MTHVHFFGPRGRTAFALLVAVASAPGLAQIDTGPTQQVVHDRAAGHTLNSVVQVLRPGSLGSGSVIGKTNFGGGANEFLCVLTAAHVAPQFLNNYQVRFGTAVNGNQVLKGGAGSWAWQHPTADVALIALSYGAADAFFNNITPITRANFNLPPGSPGALPGSVFNQFTQVGYGGTGNFVAGGMDAVAAANGTTPETYSLVIDNNKRFQNNVLKRTVGNINSSGRPAESYTSVEWDFDPAAAQAFTGLNPSPAGAQPFLVAAGLSYAGDSGGPYFSYAGAIEAETVPGFNRPGQNNWTAGGMPLRADSQIAVHTYGDSVPVGNGTSQTFFTPYGIASGGVPLTADLNAMLDVRCMLVPAPGAASLLGMAGLLAFRRRRP